MKRLIVLSFFTLLLTYSCTWDVQTTPIYGNSALSDGNSKIWLVNSLMKDGLDYQQPEYNQRDLIIFYSTGFCRIIKWKDFCSKKGDIFYYRLIRNKGQNPTLTLIRKNKRWNFEFTQFTNDKMVLVPKHGTSFKYIMTLIPLPEW